MSNRKKKFARMKNNPKGDWTIKDCMAFASYFEVDGRQGGKGSHYVFDFGFGSISIPAHGKIEARYIKQFTQYLERTNDFDNL